MNSPYQITEAKFLDIHVVKMMDVWGLVGPFHLGDDDARRHVDGKRAVATWQ